MTDSYVSTQNGRIGYALPVPYDPAATYALRDVVQYGGGAYVVLRDGITGVTPVDDGVHYRLLCARGAPGSSNAVWLAGTAVTGTGGGITASVPGSKAGDMYLNTATSDIYSATAADAWHWEMRLSDLAPGAVASVNGQTGAVVLGAGDVRMAGGETVAQAIGGLSGAALPLSGSDPTPITAAMEALDAGKQGKRLAHRDVAVPASAWAATDPVTDAGELAAGYAYAAEIVLPGVTAASYVSEVSFAPAHRDGGNFSGNCRGVEGGVVIFAKEAPTEDMTIPQIVAWP